jgi:RNA polymerase sigma factor (sigma-70 family)
MAARSYSESLRGAIHAAFDDMSAQLSKHKDHLRSQYRYPGVRGEERPPIAQVRFEDTIAAIQTVKVSSADVNGFVNANLDRLRRYVERELAFRRDSGQRRLLEVSTEEVINEAIASALDEHFERPERIALEAWLYRLSRSAMDRLGNQLEKAAVPQRPQHAEMLPSLDAGDEEMMQFYLPDESAASENPIADQANGTPEDAASREELMRMVERSLRGATAYQREAFLLFTIEGFRPAEIAAITERAVEQVQSDIRTAREHLQHALKAAGEKRQKSSPERMTAHPRSA